MQSTNWAPEHSDVLREYLAKGMSYSEIAAAINAKFKTAYSRSSAIGRAKRMGLTGPKPREDLPGHWPGPRPEANAPPLRKMTSRSGSCGRCRFLNGRSLQSSAASKSHRAIFP